MARPTRRGATLLGVALITYLSARMIGTWELYLLALAFAGMVGVGWALVWAGGRRLTVDRQVIPARPVAGDPLRFEFRVTSSVRLPGLHVMLSGATAGAPGMPEVVDVEGPGHGRRPVVAGPRPARRGVYRLPAFTATIEDPMGLARARRTTGEPMRLTIPPRLAELTSCAACSEHGARQGGGRRRLPTRDAWEFRSVRPHTPGEPVDRVDWKSTAKTATLMLREMEADSEDDLALVLDAPQGADVPAAGGGRATADAFETAVVAAGTIAAFTLRAGHAVSWLAPGTGRGELRLAPGAAGRRQLLAELAAAEPHANGPLASALPAVPGGRSAPRRRRLVLVTTRTDGDFAGAIAVLRRRGAAVSVVHVLAGSPATPAAGTAGDDAGRTLAAAGVGYYPVTSPESLPRVLSARTGGRLARAR